MSRKRLEEEDSESSNDEEQASGTSIPLSREDITARRRIRRRLKRKQRQQREQPRLSKQCPVCERLMPTDSEHMLHHLMACVIQAMSTLPSHRSFPQFMPPAMQSTVPIAPASLPTVSHQIPNPVPAPAQSTPISTPNSQSTSSSITPPGTPTVVLMSNTTPVQSIPIPAAAVLPQTPAQVQIQQKPKGKSPPKNQITCATPRCGTTFRPSNKYVVRIKVGETVLCFCDWKTHFSSQDRGVLDILMETYHCVKPTSPPRPIQFTCHRPKCTNHCSTFICIQVGQKWFNFCNINCLDTWCLTVGGEKKWQDLVQKHTISIQVN